MSRPDYAIVTGYGRSGTTWLLELFDCSSETFCRNEPDLIPASPLIALSNDGRLIGGDQDELVKRWDAAVDWTARHMGDGDLRIRVPKSYIYAPSGWLGLYRAAHGPKLRPVFAKLVPALRGGEWPLHWWLGSGRRLSRAVPVLKLLGSPGWMVFVLRNRPGVPVFHLVRHPGGFLNSWSRRYLALRERNEVTSANRERLRELASVDSSWGERFGDIDGMSAEESELWSWRYCNEVVHEAGRASDHYHHIIYEDLVRDPIPIMKRLYAACGLRWSKTVERSIESKSPGSPSIASAWRDRLQPEQQELIERLVRSGLSFYPHTG
jgi:hypothetical protein